MKIKRQVSNIWYMTKYFWRFGKKYLFFILHLNMVIDSQKNMLWWARMAPAKQPS